MFEGLLLEYQKGSPYYNGDVNLLAYVRNPELAVDEDTNYKILEKKGHVVRPTINFETLGRTHKMTLPMVDGEADSHKDVTGEFFAYIQGLVAQSILNDDRLFIFWKHLLRDYKVRKSVIEGIEIINFKYIKDQTPGSSDKTVSSGLNFSDTNIGMTVGSYVSPYMQIGEEYNTPREMEDKVFSILKSFSFKKEVILGQLRETDLNNNNQEISIGRKYEMNSYDIGSDDCRRISFDDCYIPFLRDKAFGMNKYRKRTGQVLQSRQYLCKVLCGWETYIASCRRAGKTRWIAEVINEEAFRERTEFEEEGPIKIAYVGLSKKGNRRIVEYCKVMSKAFARKGMVSFRPNEQQLVYFDYVKADGGKMIKEEVAIVDFVGSKDFFPGVGEGYDLIIIDEADKIPKDVFDDYYAIVSNESARLICISTMNPDQEKTWFYENLIAGEHMEFERNMNGESGFELINQLWDEYGLDKLNSMKKLREAEVDLHEIKIEYMNRREKVGIRIPGREVDRYTKLEKENQARKLKQQNYQKYLAEWECVFPEKSVVLDAQKARIEESELIHRRFQFIVVTRDIAEDGSDNRTLQCFVVDNEQSSDYYGSMIQVGEKEITGDIANQIPQIMPYIQDMQLKWCEGGLDSKYIFVLDARGVGATAHLLLQKHDVRVYGRMKMVYSPNYKRKTTEQSRTQKARKKEGIFIIEKQGIVEFLQDNMIGSGLLKISSACPNTLSECKTFQKITNNRGYILYEAKKGCQDGHITGLLQATYVFDQFLDGFNKGSRIKAERLWNAMQEQYSKLGIGDMQQRAMQAQKNSQREKARAISSLRSALFLR